MRKKKIAALVCVMVLFSAALASAQDYNFRELVEVEAAYILSCQSVDDPSGPAYGAINNVAGPPTWVSPRENALAILGLLKAQEIMGQDPGGTFKQRAQLCAEYLLRVQDADGSWFNQYTGAKPGAQDRLDREALAKSPTQTALVMIALYRLGYEPQRYPAMKRAAQYLMNCQKKGGDGFLLGAGKDASGEFRSWRWASDNSYAYQALAGAEIWAAMHGEYRFAMLCASAARKIVKGIDAALYIKNPYDQDFGVWYRVLDGQNQPVEPQRHDGGNYAPQMLGVPCLGCGHSRVGGWIHRTLQKADGGCVYDDFSQAGRFSSEYTFQAVVCWRALGQNEYYIPALNWALASGLWQVDPSGSSSSAGAGGWIDWIEPGSLTASREPLRAPDWQRSVETSFFAIAAFNGGYDFSIVPSFLRIGYRDPRTAAGAIPYYLKFKLTLPPDLAQ